MPCPAKPSRFPKCSGSAFSQQPTRGQSKPNRLNSNTPGVKPYIAEALSAERWYGNGDPNWENSLTSKRAEHRRCDAIKRLRRFAKSDPGAAELADFLVNCEPHHRCGNGACSECSRAIQRWLVANVRRLLT
jgi:hypothetical protein